MTDKVAIYTRVSTSIQVEEGDSLEMQRERLINYAKLVLMIDDYEVFEDPGYSGKNTDRPAFQQMMSRLRTGEFSHLLVWKIDRISRNVLDFAQMYAELKSLGVVFVSSLERFDTGTAMGEAMLKIILVFAELERNMTAERVSAVMLSRAERGQWNGGRIPYGYNYDPETTTFSINPEEAKVYDLIIETYEKTGSIPRTVTAINNLGLKSRLGNDWSFAAVHKLLTSPFYLGDYVYNVHEEKNGWKSKDPSEWVTTNGHHPALISVERHDRITYKLTENRRNSRKKGDSYHRKHVHLFAGLIECGICGGNYIATRARTMADGLRPSVYNCSYRRKHLNDCSNPLVLDTVIAPFVFRFISNMLTAQKKVNRKTSAKALAEMITDTLNCSIPESTITSLLSITKANRGSATFSPESILETKETEASSESAILYERQKKNESALTRLKNLYLFGTNEMSASKYVVEREKILNEQKEIEKRLAELVEEGSDNDAYLEQKASWLVMLKLLEEPDRFDYRAFAKAVDMNVPKAFLNTVISRIFVTYGKVTKIVLKNGLNVEFLHPESN